MTSTVTETDSATITRDDIAALRSADSVSLHSSTAHGCYVRAYVNSRTIYSATWQRLFPDTDTMWRSRTIAVSAHVYAHNSDGRSWSWQSSQTDPDEHPACFYSAYRVNVLATVWASLTAGDSLQLHWVADNNSETIRRADLHADEVSLRVSRPNSRSKDYLLGYSITPDNSARMIRRHA